MNKKRIYVIALALVVSIVIVFFMHSYNKDKYPNDSVRLLKFVDDGSNLKKGSFREFVVSNVVKYPMFYNKKGIENKCTVSLIQITNNLINNGKIKSHLMLLITNRSGYDINSDFKLKFNAKYKDEYIFKDMELNYLTSDKKEIPDGYMNYVFVEIPYSKSMELLKKQINKKEIIIEVLKYDGDDRIKWSGEKREKGR